MAISRSLIPQQISKGGKMPRVGEKHFKYTKEGREKAKKHAKKTGQEIEYMGGGVVNRKYYAMGGKIQAMRKKRKEKKARKPGSVAARRAALLGIAQLGLAAGRAGRAGATPSTMREYKRKFGQNPSRAGTVGKLRAQAAQDALRQAEIGHLIGELSRTGRAASKKTTRKKVGPDWHKKGKKYAEGGRAGTVGKFRDQMQKMNEAFKQAHDPRVKREMYKKQMEWLKKYFPRDVVNKGIRPVEKLKVKPRKSKTQGMAQGGKIKKAAAKALRKFPVIGSRGSKHFPKVIGKFPIIGKPFKVLSKLKKKGKK